MSSGQTLHACTVNPGASAAIADDHTQHTTPHTSIAYNSNSISDNNHIPTHAPASDHHLPPPSPAASRARPQRKTWTREKAGSSSEAPCGDSCCSRLPPSTAIIADGVVDMGVLAGKTGPQDRVRLNDTW